MQHLLSQLTRDLPILGQLDFPDLKWALGVFIMSILPSLPHTFPLEQPDLFLQLARWVSLLIRAMRPLLLSSELILQLSLPQ